MTDTALPNEEDRIATKSLEGADGVPGTARGNRKRALEHIEERGEALAGRSRIGEGDHQSHRQVVLRGNRLPLQLRRSKLGLEVDRSALDLHMDQLPITSKLQIGCAEVPRGDRRLELNTPRRARSSHDGLRHG